MPFNGPVRCSFIIDLHQDPHYKVFSSTGKDDACHRGKGTAGTYGAETSDCDTPQTLIDATFKWIKENVRDNVDFVVWTGDRLVLLLWIANPNDGDLACARRNADSE